MKLSPPGYTLARDVPLRTTFRVAARSAWCATVHDESALPALLDEPDVRGLPVLVLGEGSNVLFVEPVFPGLVVHLACDGIRVLPDYSTGDLAHVHVEAARNWDALVDWTLERGLRGLENLALIPGQVGAAPIQNIGAYGVEVGELTTAVLVYDRAARTTVRLTPAECGFAYRDSVFKREPDRRIVLAVELALARDDATRLEYEGLREELVAMGGLPATPRNVAAAVRRIRRRKLPDPAVIGNAGSFFKNPIVSLDLAVALRERYPEAPSFAMGEARLRKLSAAWLINAAGWRGFREGDAGVSAQHALVLVNHGTATGAQLAALARRVADSVEAQFGVRLEPEPRLVGARGEGAA
jgi:UDP-N-acetylmuramate dehydrogenase